MRIADSKPHSLDDDCCRGVELEPGALQASLAADSDEWQHHIEGVARMTVLGAEQKTRAFDCCAGNVGYVPFAMWHYIENAGFTPLRFLESFKSECFADVSLNQWLAPTSRALVRAHPNLEDNVVSKLPAGKTPIVSAK